MNPRIIGAVFSVCAAHLGALSALLTNRVAPQPQSSELQEITAELLSVTAQPAPAALPAATPKKVSVTPRTMSQRLPEPTSSSPVDTTHFINATQPTSSTMPTARTALAPTLNVDTPQNVRHIECSIVQPAYPALSRQREETGTVFVRIVVDSHGRVEKAALKQSSGFERLDQVALKAALASPCRAYMENGRSMRATTEVPFKFSLED